MDTFQRTSGFAYLLLNCSFRLIWCDDCLTNEDDTGALYIRQLQDFIDAASCELVNNTRYEDYTPTDDEEFDFIVVGAGSAGSVLANRLSENPSWRVLLLEAGGDPPVTSEIPFLATSMWNTEVDWKYSSEPDPMNCLGSINQRCLIPRGKVVGGSSTINTMLYVRGHPEDFNGWEKMGNPGWGFNDMLRYFKKSEGFRLDSIIPNDPKFFKFHGIKGPLKVDYFRYDLEVSNNISKGFEELGFEVHPDYNIEFGNGVFPLQATVENTRRCSAAKAFLHNVQQRPNLKISKHSLVDKLLVDEHNTAYGVSFIKNGVIFSVRSSKELVLSAGVINSPQLLMLSGIGPREHLEEVGVKVKQNLKVGYNLHDHPNFAGFLVTLDLTGPIQDETEGIFQFLVEEKGYLTSFPSLSITSYITTGQASYRNTQLFYQYYKANSSDSLKGYSGSSGFDENITNSIGNITSKSFGIIPVIVNVRPKSRGRILLNSSSSQASPLIYPGYLHEEEDVRELLDGIQFLNLLVKTRPFLSLGAKVHRIDIPGCRNFEFQTEDYWRCTIKYMVTSTYHMVGSCKMGPRDHEDSVVDPELRVIGVSNLRVVDASIMPAVTSGNTNAPVIAIAEKGADLIKQSWTSQQQDYQGSRI